MRFARVAQACLVGTLWFTPVAPAAQPKSTMLFPDAPGRDVVQKVCGVCHGAEMVAAKGLNRQDWAQVIASMVTRGAKGSDEEFSQVLDYLTRVFPPKPAAGGPAVTAAPRHKGGGAGPDDVQVVDAAAADRGRTTYIAECITCHGPKARGKNGGPDLVRSLVILHDRYGSTVGPFLAKGHPMQSGSQSASLNQPQIADLSHFLHQRVDDTLRSGPYSKVINVLTGDAKAGSAFFHGAGQCATCHATDGDLAAIAKKYDPPTLQQRFLFPQSGGFARGGRRTAPVTVTVTPASGQPVNGVLLGLDDFNVALRDAAGQYHSWERTPGLKVEKHDPFAAHEALLDQYTDKNIHDVVAYLETLK